MIERADAIVTGQVISKNGRMLDWTDKNKFDNSMHTRKQVMTEYETDILKVIKGEFRTTKISFWGFGGEAEGRRTSYSFGFDCEPGDTVMVFLVRREMNDVWMVIGQSQGVFKLEKSGDSLRIKNLNRDTLIMRSGDEDLEAFLRRQQKELNRLLEDR